MFCKFKGSGPDAARLIPETTYWVSFRTPTDCGILEATIGAFWRRMYTNFEEFMEEWEIV